jgi:hypothetical protein
MARLMTTRCADNEPRLGERPSSSLRFPNAATRFHVLVNVFAYLDSPASLARCARVSRLWKPIADAPTAWAPMAIRVYGADPADMGHGKVEVRLRRLEGHISPHKRSRLAPSSRPPMPARSTFSSVVLPTTAESGSAGAASAVGTNRRFASINSDAAEDAPAPRQRFSDGLNQRPVSKAPRAPKDAPLLIPITLPRRSVEEELRAVTEAAYRRIGPRPLTVADQCDILEEHEQALGRRLQAVAPQTKSLAHNFDQIVASGAKLAADARALVEEKRTIEAHVPKHVSGAIALATRARRLRLFKDFERACAFSVLHPPISAPASASPAERSSVTRGMDQDTADAVASILGGGGFSPARRAPEAAPPVRPAAGTPTCLETFAQLEMYCANPRHIGTAVYMRWSQLKRSLPLTDVYYDVRDAVLDPGAFDVDELVVRKWLNDHSSSEDAATNTAGVLSSAEDQHALAMRTCGEIVRRAWQTGPAPPLAGALLGKIGRVVAAVSAGGIASVDIEGSHFDV